MCLAGFGVLSLQFPENCFFKSHFSGEIGFQQAKQVVFRA